MPVVILWDNGASKLTLPIWKNEALDFGANPSEHPVERGTPIADHVEVANAKGTFEVVVSNTPIRPNEFGGADETVDLQTLQLTLNKHTYEVKVPTYTPIPGPFEVGGIVNALIPKSLDFDIEGLETKQEIREVKQRVLTWSSEFDACRDVLDKLRKLQLERTLVEIAFSYQTISDAVLTKVAPVRNQELGAKALTLAISFEQLRFGTVERVATPLPTEPRGKSKTGKGSQGSKDPKGQSFLSKIVNKFKGAQE